MKRFRHRGILSGKILNWITHCRHNYSARLASKQFYTLQKNCKNVISDDHYLFSTRIYDAYSNVH